MHCHETRGLLAKTLNSEILTKFSTANKRAFSLGISLLFQTVRIFFRKRKLFIPIPIHLLIPIMFLSNLSRLPINLKTTFLSRSSRFPIKFEMVFSKIKWCFQKSKPMFLACKTIEVLGSSVLTMQNLDDLFIVVLDQSSYGCVHPNIRGILFFLAMFQTPLFFRSIREQSILKFLWY